MKKTLKNTRHLTRKSTSDFKNLIIPGKRKINPSHSLQHPFLPHALQMMAINNNHTRVKRVVSPISNEVQQNDIFGIISFPFFPQASIGDRKMRTTLPSFAYETGSKEMKELSDRGRRKEKKKVIYRENRIKKKKKERVVLFPSYFTTDRPLRAAKTEA
ncbi:hypothetical protein CDAR_369951 [Caerostris darwini]|uniref:Ribosomal protein S18 n=1 Tax=Caerostris darwini TaxID=1538125 RepID=A0AAV4PZB3_9ARAC|nr:hypothetical protein CDAR_369951 [Caerostris darwini]